MQTKISNNPLLLQTIKSILQQQYIGSQTQLSQALTLKGYGEISQAKISRMLKKVGAVRTRNAKSEMVYHLPDETISPQTKQTVNSMVLDVRHNGMQIILKTILGGASVISRIIDTMGEPYGILGCIADDNTILVIPTNINKIEEIAHSLIEHLEVHS
jgi:transcriptional regulator of arginine metabolism